MQPKEPTRYLQHLFITYWSGTWCPTACHCCSHLIFQSQSVIGILNAYRIMKLQGRVGIRHKSSLWCSWVQIMNPRTRNTGLNYWSLFDVLFGSCLYLIFMFHSVLSLSSLLQFMLIPISVLLSLFCTVSCYSHSLPPCVLLCHV